MRAAEQDLGVFVRKPSKQAAFETNPAVLDIVNSDSFREKLLKFQQGATFKILVADPAVPGCPVAQAVPGCLYDFEQMTGKSDDQMIGQPLR